MSTKDQALHDCVVALKTCVSSNELCPHCAEFSREVPTFDGGLVSAAIAKAESALSAPAAVPEGFVLVPIEPTDAMLRAIRKQRSGARVGKGDRDNWKVMIAATKAGKDGAA